MAGKPMDQQIVGLPPLIFLFTIDQLAVMLNVTEQHVMTVYLYYVNRSSGIKKTHQMSAINIAPDNATPDWRVSSKEFFKWCQRKGITVNQFSGMR